MSPTQGTNPSVMGGEGHRLGLGLSRGTEIQHLEKTEVNAPMP